MQTAKAFATLLASSLLGVLAAPACGGSSVAIDDPPVTATQPTAPDPADTPPANPTTPAPPAPTTPAPPTTPKATIACGTASCTAGAQECCVTAPTGGGGGAAPTNACVAKGTCDGDLVLSCSSAASCSSGQVCCLDIGGGGSTSSCKTACTGGSGPGGRPIQLCDTDAECKSKQCQPAQFGFKVCASNGGGVKDGGGAPKLDGGKPEGGGGFGGM